MAPGVEGKYRKAWDKRGDLNKMRSKRFGAAKRLTYRNIINNNVYKKALPMGSEKLEGK